MNLSIEMLSNRRQQSLELQRGEDHTEPRSNLVIKHKLTQGSTIQNGIQTRKRNREKSYEAYNQKI